VVNKCQSDCDCGAPDGTPHEPDCHSFHVCEDGRYCDSCYRAAVREFAYLQHVPRYAVMDDDLAREELNAELRDAGRGHLVRP